MRKFILDVRFIVYVEEFKRMCKKPDEYVMPYFWGKHEIIIEANTLPEAIYKAIEIVKKKEYGYNRYQMKAIRENKIYFDVRLKMRV